MWSCQLYGSNSGCLNCRATVHVLHFCGNQSSELEYNVDLVIISGEGSRVKASFVATSTYHFPQKMTP